MNGGAQIIGSVNDNLRFGVVLSTLPREVYLTFGRLFNMLELVLARK
jgi:hypothetical protein